MQKAKEFIIDWLVVSRIIMVAALTWLNRRSDPFHETGSMHHTRNRHFTTR